MTTQEQDFWGDIGVEAVSTPSTILKQQAGLLGVKTKHLLEAEVRTSTSGEFFVHSFDLVVPSLDNYTYELFKVRHGIALYPVVAYNGGRPVQELGTEDEFKQWVHQKLSSLETKKIIANLLSLARS